MHLPSSPMDSLLNYWIFRKLQIAASITLLLLSTQTCAKSVEVDQLVRVYDGDTITVDINGWPPIIGDDISIRVRGLDTPEIRGKCDTEKEMAQNARNRLQQLLEASELITLVDYERGKYFRLVATVMADGKDVAETLIGEGLARPYDGGKREGWCE